MNETTKRPDGLQEDGLQEDKGRAVSPATAGHNTSRCAARERLYGYQCELGARHAGYHSARYLDNGSQMRISWKPAAVEPHDDEDNRGNVR